MVKPADNAGGGSKVKVAVRVRPFNKRGKIYLSDFVANLLLLQKCVIFLRTT